jgi:hypothetical protein
MGKNFLCLAAMFCISVGLCAQLNESFSDGNFTANPAWSGNVADWQVVASSDVGTGATGSGTLRLNVAAGSGVTYLSTHVTGGWGPAQSWGFFIGRRSQAYTAANHVLIWLWASDANLLAASVNGYRIRIGDDAGGDEMVLQKVVNGTATDILVSTNAMTNGITDVGFLLRVTRSNTGAWQLFTSALPSANGTGAIASDVPNAANASVLQGAVTDNTFSAFDNGYVGFVNAYGSGTAARAAQEFDQVQLSFANNSLPVRLSNFSATSTTAGAYVRWEVLEETNVKAYEIQSSGNGTVFTAIGALPAMGRSNYELATAKSNFYRLRIIDQDGSSVFSPVVSLRIKASSALKIIYEGAGSIRVQHPQVPGQSTLRIMNAAGRLVEERSIPPNAGTTKLNIAALPRGWYLVEWMCPHQHIGVSSNHLNLSRLFTSFSSL